MTDLGDADENFDNENADENDSLSKDLRGCKRKLEVAPSKAARDDAVTATDDGGPNDDTAATEALDDPIEGKIAPIGHTVGTSWDLPEGMRLEWNSSMTRAILTVLEMTSDTASVDRELRVCLVGRAKIHVIEGSAEILGHSLEPRINNKSDDDTSVPVSGVVVTSPYWSSWMTIEANPKSLPCKIVLDCIRGPETFRMMPPKRPIVLPHSWRTCADAVVQDFCFSSSNVNRFGRSAAMADSLEDYDPGHRNSDDVRRICMITGAKGVGKSTLLRYLTNRILSASSSRSDDNGWEDDQNYTNGIEEVAILDTDLGQPELAPPGLLRLSIVRKPLLQPPYWNLVGETIVDDEEKWNGEGDDRNDEQQGVFHGPQQQQQHRPVDDEDDDGEEGKDDVEVVSTVYFGASTSKVDPARYIEAVQFLMGKYETEVVHSGTLPIPLLINMDGWVKGFGYQILTALINSLGPTHLVQILGDTPGQTFDLPPTVFGSTSDDGAEPTDFATTESPDETFPPKVCQLQACQILPGASLCRIPAFTMRNFRWATYFLPNELQTFDAWDFASAKDLQTGWIVATNSEKTSTVPRWWHATNESDDDDEERIVSELIDDCRLAHALARERPYIVPMEAVDAFVIGSDYEDYLRVPAGETDNDVIDRIYNRIYRALNGCIVALCTNTLTMESLGYGILRSIDWEQRLLYILVPPTVVAGTKNPSLLLSRVKALVGGNQPLPLAMLYRGVSSESFPYLDDRSQQHSAILGSEPMKSRNSIGRRGLENAKRNAN